jgi:DHA1 family inner membrane transport protein
MLLMAKARNAPTMAAASNHSAFNLANAGGAWLGGLAISAGWGWASPALVGAVLAAAGLALAVAGGLVDRGSPSEVIASAGATPEAAPVTAGTPTGPATATEPVTAAELPAGPGPEGPSRRS